MYDNITGETVFRQSEECLWKWEDLINHEFMHFILHKLVGVKCSYQYDDVDIYIVSYLWPFPNKTCDTCFYNEGGKDKESEPCLSCHYIKWEHRSNWKQSKQHLMINNNMMAIDVIIGRHTSSEEAVATYNYEHKYIKLGCDYKIINAIIKAGGVVPYYKEYVNMKDVYEDDVETFLVHEFLHILLWEIEDKSTSTLFDNIDRNREISGLKSK